MFYFKSKWKPALTSLIGVATSKNMLDTLDR